MKVGTKSVLYGAHCFAIHPWFVALAWWKLYGFPWDPRLWVAFFVHDLGYIGKPNMDGPEGETHVELGARIMRLFDRRPYTYQWLEWSYGGKGVWWRLNPEQFNALLLDGWQIADSCNEFALLCRPRFYWNDLTLFHSRYYAKRHGMPFSRLCVADKLAFCLTPSWLYLPMVSATGEIHEYLKNAQRAESAHWKPTGYDARVWHAALCGYMSKWVAEHRDGAKDTWTSIDRHARSQK